LKVDTVTVDTGNYQDYIATGADSDNFDEHDRHSGSRTTDDDIQNPFTQFPTGTESSGPTGGGSFDPRNPLTVCRTITGECPSVQ
jgi:hypothetical protein